MSGPGEEPRYIYFVNTHLHSIITDDFVRLQQAQHLVYWVEKKADLSKDLIIAVGDFNAKPDSKTYAYFKEAGYVSASEEANGKEPEFTFPTKLDAEFIDKDPPGTFDYIFIKGMSDDKNSFKVNIVEQLGGDCDAMDSTICGSDHYSLAADLEIVINK